MGGKICHKHGVPCIGSFPGKYGGGWNKVMEVGDRMEDDNSVATVFLPKLTPKFGSHAENPETNRCYCYDMYGEEKEWGCEWFSVWSSNIEEAVSWKQRLQVFFFEGMKGKGKV